MAGYLSRDTYLQKLINSKDNNSVKVVTGPGRCGKSWLLERVYKDWLLSQDVGENNIIIVSFDIEDENNQSELTDRNVSDINTILRGRGDEIRVWPFSFREFCQEREEDRQTLNLKNSIKHIFVEN